MDRRRPHHGKHVAWRWICFFGSVAIVYFSVSQLMSGGDKTATLAPVPNGAEPLPGSAAAALKSDALETDAHAAAIQQQQQQQQQQEQPKQEQQQEERREGQAEAGAQQGDAQNAETGEVTCHGEEHAEYEGDLVNWGHSDVENSSESCCDKCRGDARCNLWVWCGKPAGCGAGLRHQQCWLKHLVADPVDLTQPPGRRGPDVPWTAGVIYIDGQREAAEARIAAENAKERQRLLDLRNNEHLPLVFMDVSIKGEAIGRMVFVLFPNESPRAAENYRQLFTGEKGLVPEGHEGAGRPYHFKGTSFYRIIDRFIDQGGAGTDSVFGGPFKDDPGGLKLKHDRKGLLSIANAGPDTNDSHFSIMMGPEPHNDGHYTVFGELVEGWEVAWRINQLSVGKPDNQAGREEEAVITDSGQLRRGDPIVLPAEQ